jgi:energy-coupling factor transport system ATP-binding protein
MYIGKGNMQMDLIKTQGVGHKYQVRDKDGNVIGEKWAVKDMDFTAHKGEIIAIIGKNGSGKSTFAKHLNGLLYPDEGSVFIGKVQDNSSCLDTRNESDLLDIRQQIGMVFQNPDNQMVGNTIAEDIGFGLENIGCETEKIWKRIHETLELTGMSGFVDRNTAHLSGGQKQRLAIASILAMKPTCIVMDEATSMIDPEGSKKILDTIFELNKQFGIAVIMITHRIEEVKNSDYIYVMENSRVKFEGKPEEVFVRVSELEQAGLESLLTCKLWDKLGLNNVSYKDFVELEKTAELIKDKFRGNLSGEKKPKYSGLNEKKDADIISVNNVSYKYKDGKNDIYAVKDISFNINRGEMVAVAGHTGSGKSTLLHMINGLLRPMEGSFVVNGYDVVKTKNLKGLRKTIGFVFQYPEYQLFETTVIKDVMYGAVNFGMNKKDALQAAKNAMNMVGIGEEYYEYSPFELSGGQKKRVALAGILAYEPEILILDEPVAGLDAETKKSLFSLLRRLNREKGVTVIFVSHDMKDVYEIADRILVLKSGSIVYDGDVMRLLEDEDRAAECGLVVPEVPRFKKMLMPDMELHGRNAEELAEEILDGNI